MRAKRNNKGYSLVELLITIAIFGMVMIGIAMIMRTSSVSYVKGNSEVAMQTEVQIVANQLEELFVDADGAIDSGYISSGGEMNGTQYWKIPKGDYNYYICFFTADNELLLQKRELNTGYLVNKSAWSLMAEYVTDFDVEGWEQRQENVEPTDSCDNKITFELAMDNNGYAYEVSRDVFFRNAIEDALVYEIQDTGTGDDETETVIEYELDRYAVLDLEKEFGITTITGVSSASSTQNTFNSFYRFVKPAYNDIDNEEPAFGIEKVEDDDGSACCIMLKSNFYDDYGLEVFKSYNIIVTGTTDKPGEVVEVRLVTKPVSFVADNNAFHLHATNGGDYSYTFVKVEGIDIPAMLAIKDYTTDANADNTGRPFQYSLVMYSTDATTPQYTKDANNLPKTETSNVVEHATSSCFTSTNESGCGVRCQIGLRADPGSDGMVIICSLTDRSVSDVAAANIATGKMRLAIMVHLPYQTTTESHYVYDIPVLGQGNALPNYAPVQVYDMTPASFGANFTTDDLSTVYP